MSSSVGKRLVHYDQIDGVRLFILLVIIASHTGVNALYGQGSAAVSLFFVLSGLFMTSPSIEDGEEYYISLGNILRFYVLRIVRIIPLYWGLLLLFYWISDSFITSKDMLLSNMFFTNTVGPFWFLQHEVVNYLLAPLVLILIYLAKRFFKAKNWMIAIAMGAISLGVSKFLLSTAYFCLLWSGEPRQSRFGLFLMGVCLGYVIKALHQKKIYTWWGKVLGDIVLIGALGGISFLTAEPVLVRFFGEKYVDMHIGWEHPIVCAVISSVALLLLIVNHEGLVSKILRIPMVVAMGRVSYGAFLVHAFLLEFIVLSPMKRFVLIAMLSFGVAYVSYELMEKPLYQYVKKRIK